MPRSPSPSSRARGTPEDAAPEVPQQVPELATQVEAASLSVEPEVPQQVPELATQVEAASLSVEQTSLVGPPFQAVQAPQGSAVGVASLSQPWQAEAPQAEVQQW